MPALEGITGVGDVEVTGGLEDEVTITLDPVALAQSGIGYPQIQAALAASSVTIPAGELPAEDESIPVTVVGEITSTEELEGIVVGLDQAAEVPVPVTLGDVATVEEMERATTGYARFNGNEALSLTVNKTSSANTVDVSEAVNEALDDIEANSGADLQIDIVSDQADFIIESRDGLLREGALGAVFAVLTIFAFLFSLRSTFVAAISIPLSLLVALVVMQVTGITMNILTLGGLAVAVGRVVDDSIVVLENIYRHRAMGEDRRTASLRGPAEVSGAITWSTLTTVAVFLPLGFAGGLISQFFLPFALTVTFALLASLVVALTVVPVLGYFLVRPPAGSRRRGRRAETLHLGPALRSDHPGRPAQPMDVPGDGLWRTCPVRRLALPGAAPADRVHQLGLREDPRRQRLATTRAPRRRLCAIWLPRPRPSSWRMTRSRTSRQASRRRATPDSAP